MKSYIWTAALRTSVEIECAPPRGTFVWHPSPIASKVVNYKEYGVISDTNRDSVPFDSWRVAETDVILNLK